MKTEKKEKAIDNISYQEDKKEKQKNNCLQTAEIPKDLSYEDAVKVFKMSLDRDPKNTQEVIDFFKNRKLSKLPNSSTKV